MMLRRLSDRARVEGMRTLQRVLDNLRGYSGRHAGDLYLVREPPLERGETSEPISSRITEAERIDAMAEHPAGGASADESMPIHVIDGDVEQTKALHRIADSIERLGAQIDSYHHERAQHLDAIEFLLREMVIGTVAPSGTPAIVLGGVIDPDALDGAGPEITIIADGLPLEVDTPVEVRSRFHDRWICGFAIAEAVETVPGILRYRLTRRSDGIPLPILFDAGDVRATTSEFDPQARN